MQTLVIGVECHCGRTGWKLNVKNAQGENSHKHAPNHKCRRVYILCYWIILSVRYCDAENEDEKSWSERAILNVNRILSLSFIKYASNRHLNPTNGNMYVWKKYCAINHIYRKLNRQMINDIGVEIKIGKCSSLTHTYKSDTSQTIGTIPGERFLIQSQMRFFIAVVKRDDFLVYSFQFRLALLPRLIEWIVLVFTQVNHPLVVGHGIFVYIFQHFFSCCIFLSPHFRSHL